MKYSQVKNLEKRIRNQRKELKELNKRLDNMKISNYLKDDLINSLRQNVTNLSNLNKMAQEQNFSLRVELDKMTKKEALK